MQQFGGIRLYTYRFRKIPDPVKQLDNVISHIVKVLGTACYEHVLHDATYCPGMDYMCNNIPVLL